MTKAEREPIPDASPAPVDGKDFDEIYNRWIEPLTFDEEEKVYINATKPFLPVLTLHVDKLQKENPDIAKVTIPYAKRINETAAFVQKSEAIMERHAYNERGKYQGLINLGAISIGHGTVRKYRDALQTASPDQETVNDYLDHHEFNIYGALLISINGVDISALTFPKRQDIPIDSLYRFLVTITSKLDQKKLDEILEANQLDLLSRYPVRGKKMIMDVFTYGYLVSKCKIKQLETYVLGKNSGMDKQAASFAREILETFAGYVKRFKKALEEPDSPDFDRLKPVMTDLLEFHHDPLAVLDIAGARSVADGIALYRKAKLFVEETVETDFYQKYIDVMEQVVGEDENIPILTPDDLALFFDEDSFSSTGEVSLAQLESLIPAIVSGTKDREFNLDPAGVSWEGLNPPRSISVKVGNKPKKFTVQLAYDIAGEGEKELELWINTDSKTPMFDWNALEDPNTYPRRKEISIQAVFEILKRIAKHEEEKRQMRRDAKIKAPQPFLPQTKIKRERPIPDNTGIEPEERTRNASFNTPSSGGKNTARAEKKGVSLFIVSPDPSALESLLKGFPTESQKLIMDKITAFNNSQGKSGIFRKLVKDTYDDDLDRYTLRAGSNIRIVLIEQGGANGVRRFNIEIIKPRSIVFKKKD